MVDIEEMPTTVMDITNILNNITFILLRIESANAMIYCRLHNFINITFLLVCIIIYASDLYYFSKFSDSLCHHTGHGRSTAVLSGNGSWTVFFSRSNFRVESSSSF